jgi:hypothetical protein
MLLFCSKFFSHLFKGHPFCCMAIHECFVSSTDEMIGSIWEIILLQIRFFLSDEIKCWGQMCLLMCLPSSFLLQTSTCTKKLSKKLWNARENERRKPLPEKPPPGSINFTTFKNMCYMSFFAPCICNHSRADFQILSQCDALTKFEVTSLCRSTRSLHSQDLLVVLWLSLCHDQDVWFLWRRAWSGSGCNFFPAPSVHQGKWWGLDMVLAAEPMVQWHFRHKLQLRAHGRTCAGQTWNVCQSRVCQLMVFQPMLMVSELVRGTGQFRIRGTVTYLPRSRDLKHNYGK